MARAMIFVDTALIGESAVYASDAYQVLRHSTKRNMPKNIREEQLALAIKSLVKATFTAIQAMEELSKK